MSASAATQNISYAELEAENLRLAAQIAEQHAHIQALAAQIRSLKQLVYGRKSERFISDNQSSLFPLPEVKEEDLSKSVVSEHERKKRPGRKPLPETLPRVRVEYEPEQKLCECCAQELVKIGEEVTEELEYIPAQFKVIEHVKIKRACSHCKQGVVQGQIPPAVLPLEKCRVGAALLAFLYVSKYCDHMPLHRLEQMFLRHGIEIPRQRMCDWIGAGVEQILLVIALSLKQTIRGSAYIRADETELEVQTEEKDGKLHLGRLWGMLSYEKDLYFEYAPTRSGEVARSLLSGVAACLQTDLYSGYNVLKQEPNIVRVACWDHARRKFIEATDSAPEHVKAALSLIGELYRIEREFKDKLKKEKRALDPAERILMRRDKAKPVLDKLNEYLNTLSVSALPKSPLGAAVGYVLSSWPAFTAFVDHGLVELSNATIEQQIRPIALGRNNWFFAGSDRGAKWTAVMYSLIGTCKLNGINPYDYLADVLRRAPSMPRSAVEAELTPRAWKAKRARAALDSV